MNLRISSLAMAVALMGVASAQATVVEPFTGGALSAPGWSAGIGADASIYLSTPAPDGTYGIALSEAAWSYNTSISFAANDTLTAWINPGPGPATPGFNNAQGGRLFVGIAADATGASSFVAASDVAALGSMANPGYTSGAFTNSASQVWGDQWYELSITRSADGHSATARLFDQDGQTLLNTLTIGGLNASANGIALMGTGGVAISSVAVVPEPASAGLALVGLMLAGATTRRRRLR